MSIKILYKGDKEWCSMGSLEEMLEKEETENIIGIDLSEADITIDDTHTELLAKFINLKKLVIADTDITNLSFVKSLSKLESIDFSGTRISDIEFLEALTHLKKITAHDVSIRDFTVLEKLHNLTKLEIERTLIKELSVLSKLENLKTLDMYGCAKVNNVEPLRSLKNLTNLCLVGTDVIYAEQLHCLYELPNLEVLEVNDDLEYVASAIVKECREGKDYKDYSEESALTSFGIFSSCTESAGTGYEVLQKTELLIDTIEFQNKLKNFLRAQGIPIADEQNPGQVIAIAYKRTRDKLNTEIQSTKNSPGFHKEQRVK